MNDFGFNAHMLRKSQIEWQKLLGVRLVWSLILVAVAIGLLLFLPFATLDFKQAVVYGVLAILGSGVFVTCNLIFQQRLRYDLSVLSSSLGTFIYLILILIFIQNKVSLPALVSTFTAGWVFMGLTSLAFVYPFTKNIWPEFSFSFAKNLIKNSWPIAATLVLNVVYFRADTFMVAFFKDPLDVGIYNVAYSVFQSVLVLPTFIMNAYYPLMLKSLSGIRLVGLSLLCIAFFGTVVTLIIAPYLISIITGGGFLGASKSLQILSLGFPAYFLSSLLMWFLITKGKYKSLLLIYTSGLIINLILNMIYIPRYSFFAASWVTVISEYVILLLQLIVLKGIILG